MRMDVSQLLLHELALNVNCTYDSEKGEVKSLATKNRQCFMKELAKKEVNEKEKLKPLANSTAKIRRSFIPYPDHNYGQQPPLTPPTDDLIENQQVVERNKEDLEGSTNCICGYGHDDGYMICCDKCSCWEHIECMGIDVIPEKYMCHKCNPRVLDIEKAKSIQEKKRKIMSEADGEDEEESGDESKMLYTAISNTPTRITLMTNPQQKKNRKSKVQKRKLPESLNTRKKIKRKDRVELTPINHEDDVIVNHVPSINSSSQDSVYEEIDANICNDEIKELQLPETKPFSIDLKEATKCVSLCLFDPNRKGLFTTCDMDNGSFLTEYVGVMMSLTNFDEMHPCIDDESFILRYNKLEQMKIIVDSRRYGNIARFVRFSCTPNAEFQHVVVNGSLRILIISTTPIPKDHEILMPLVQSENDKQECCCAYVDCQFKKMQTKPNKTGSSGLLLSDCENVNPDMKNESESRPESESEHLVLEDGRHYSGLSRDERKLQAWLKQFEKLEKKVSGQKKIKEPKTPTNKVSLDDAQKCSSAKKITAKRKISVTGKRRTRQSSCSSEPVSPNDQDGSGSASSTPTAYWSAIQVQQRFDQASRKQKDGLALSLVMPRKPLQKIFSEHTPPHTPHLTTPKTLGEPSLSLSVETHFEPTVSCKPSLTNGLLQIVQTKQSPLSTHDLGNTSLEERIGDATKRHDDDMSPNDVLLNGIRTKYYGSLKKYWLNKHLQRKKQPQQEDTMELIASLKEQRYNAPSFKRPKNCIPLKKRLLLKKSSYGCDGPGTLRNETKANGTESSIVKKQLPDTPSYVKHNDPKENKVDHLMEVDVVEDPVEEKIDVEEVNEVEESMTTMVNKHESEIVEPEKLLLNVNESELKCEETEIHNDCSNPPINMLTDVKCDDTAENLEPDVDHSDKKPDITPELKTPVENGTDCTSNPVAINSSDLCLSEPDAVSETPRNSCDSNQDNNDSNTSGSEQGTRKKLSFEEYRNRQRSQKTLNGQTPSPISKVNQKTDDAPVASVQQPSYPHVSEKNNDEELLKPGFSSFNPVSRGAGEISATVLQRLEYNTSQHNTGVAKDLLHDDLVKSRRPDESTAIQQHRFLPNHKYAHHHVTVNSQPINASGVLYRQSPLNNGGVPSNIDSYVFHDRAYRSFNTRAADFPRDYHPPREFFANRSVGHSYGSGFPRHSPTGSSYRFSHSSNQPSVRTAHAISRQRPPHRGYMPF